MCGFRVESDTETPERTSTLDTSYTSEHTHVNTGTHELCRGVPDTYG